MISTIIHSTVCHYKVKVDNQNHIIKVDKHARRTYSTQVCQYKVKVDNQNHRIKVDKHARPSMYIQYSSTQHSTTLGSAQVQSKG